MDIYEIENNKTQAGKRIWKHKTYKLKKSKALGIIQRLKWTERDIR